MAKVTIIAGGHSVQSRLTGVLQHIHHRLAFHGIDAHVIQVHQLPSGALIGADFSNEDIIKAIELVKRATVSLC